MKKFGSIFMAVALGATTLAGLAGCNKQPEDSVDALDIYVLHKGNGVQWCYDMADAFLQEDWVKAKYPNLTISPIVTNDEESYASGMLNAGAGRNRFDLMFVHLDGQSYAGPTGILEDLTQSVYNSEVPGETGVKYIDKHNDSYTFINRYIDTQNASTEAYYQTTWNHGMNSFVYNETLLTALGKEVPNTTDEFLAICDYVLDIDNRPAGVYDKTFAIQQAENGYWDYLFPIWWAQYEGLENYKNFWNGIDSNNMRSPAIFDQTGILESLKFMETALTYETGYIAKDSMSYAFMEGQTVFMRGNGIFHANGDWFDNEMSEIAQQIKDEGGVASNYVFKIMKTPIISALGDKLGIDDATLSAIVDYVDGDTATVPEFTSTEGYTKDEVIDAVKEARTVVHSLGPKHAGIIPKYALCKDPAIDFLRFMATDKAQEIYMRATGGSCLPFKYNVKEKNPTLYGEMTPFHQAKLDYFCSTQYEVYTLPDDGAFPLAQYGGLTATYDVQYYRTFIEEGHTKTAADFIQETKDTWTQDKFNTALATAGM